MKFIFPQNYKFNNKLFGIIDYSTAIVNIVWYVFIFWYVLKFIKNKRIYLYK